MPASVYYVKSRRIFFVADLLSHDVAKSKKYRINAKAFMYYLIQTSNLRLIEWDKYSKQVLFTARQKTYTLLTKRSYQTIEKSQLSHQSTRKVVEHGTIITKVFLC